MVKNKNVHITLGCFSFFKHFAKLMFLTCVSLFLASQLFMFYVKNNSVTSFYVNKLALGAFIKRSSNVTFETQMQEHKHFPLRKIP